MDFYHEIFFPPLKIDQSEKGVKYSDRNEEMGWSLISDVYPSVENKV